VMFSCLDPQRTSPFNIEIFHVPFLLVNRVYYVESIPKFLRGFVSSVCLNTPKYEISLAKSVLN
jgi:hypothetical protein